MLSAKDEDGTVSDARDARDSLVHEMHVTLFSEAGRRGAAHIKVSTCFWYSEGERAYEKAEKLDWNVLLYQQYQLGRKNIAPQRM